MKSLGPTPVKGLGEPVEVYELTGASAVRSRLQAAAARGFTKFVGRSAEMTQLNDALELARKAKGQVVAVVGEPGVGKSRLFWEFTHSHRTEGCVVIEAASVSYGKATAYYPVIELLRGYFAIEPRDNARRVREKLIGKLFSLDRALEPSLPALLALLDVPVEDHTWSQLDPPQRRQRTLDGVKRLLLRESQAQPLVVVFEDLHWIDSETQALLETLIESLPTTRLLVLVNYRPEYQHPWGSKTYYRQLRIDPLPAARADELLDALLGTDAMLSPLKHLLIERTEGNPFFLEESVRTLVETGVLTGARGEYRLARAPEALQIPASAQAILAARIDRLDPDDKRLLQAAAVTGKDFSVALLAAIAEVPEETLHRGLARLQAAEFLYEKKLFPDLEYTFKHALTHEVAYASLLQSRRREIHASVVSAIERLHAERLGEHVERLAHHAVRGEQWDKAFSYLRHAGANAAARSASREAVACFEQALVALEHLPESHDTLERGVDLRFDLQSALVPLGELDRIMGYLREAETLAEALCDQRRLARASAHMTHCLWWMGDPHRAVEAGQRADASASAIRDLSLQVSTNIRLGQAYFSMAEYRRAVDVLTWNARALEGQLDLERFGMPALPAVACRVWMGWCLAHLGDFVAGIPTEREGTRLAEAANHPYSLALAYYGIGGIHLIQGDLAEATVWLERSLDLCQEGNFAFLVPRVAAELGRAHALGGRPDEALGFLPEAAAQAAAMNFMAVHPAIVTFLGEAYLLAGRAADAMETAQRALALARAGAQRGVEADALRILAAIHSIQNPPACEQAEGSYREALAIADELGMRPLVAHCDFGLGTLYRRTGKREQAREHLTTATTMYREMDMRFWLERAEAEIRELA